ncbi:MAG: hypothetical protein HQK86_06830 [Nitrospinae bacterium]|nr:hypothetical protein [Nitrospinota bacterium]MBF0635029.1 hypothetical protein [Nitrospinota bacterium]
MRTIIFSMAVVLSLSGPSFAQAKQAKEREIRTDFGFFKAGMNIFLEKSPGYKESSKLAWSDYLKAGDPKNIWATAPAGFFVSDRIATKLPVIVVTSPDQGCDTAPRLLFLAGPPTSGPNQPGGTLFSYEYNVCDTSGLLSSDEMIFQYMTKYGVHDAKDYGRNMIVYNNVRGGLRVGVRPMEGAKDRAGITITVVNDNAFRDVYQLWRSLLRKSDKRAREEF